MALSLHGKPHSRRCCCVRLQFVTRKSTNPSHFRQVAFESEEATVDDVATLLRSGNKTATGSKDTYGYGRTYGGRKIGAHQVIIVHCDTPTQAVTFCQLLVDNYVLRLAPTCVIGATTSPSNRLQRCQVMVMVALACSLTSVSATNVQQSQMHASHYPLSSGQAFNPVAFPLVLSPASGPQSPISEGFLRSKGLGLIDLILLKQLTSRVNQLEETVKNLTNSNFSSSNQGSGAPTSIGGMPKSCDDLQKLGNSKSGFYNIKNSTRLATVFCDFTKPVGDAGFQQWMGDEDAQSKPVYFNVQKLDQLSTDSELIPFEIVRVNQGDAMNASAGIFTAPVNGTYFFSFTSYNVDLMLNGANVAKAQIDESNVEDFHNDSLHLEATLVLTTGDRLWLKPTKSTGILLEGFRYTYFTGMLLAEDIFPAA
ncbi:hypothetical protein GHT06_014540 [Daphnia sinensis]|uniref:C1q domain-containing protein n=1 Tax=Daphnia sinensis TaxID=1820382 RepID=A0AAD5PS27_9CRUS|nr:hypothetical protein GHT06_014540 [Daphnia sinensis]